MEAMKAAEIVEGIRTGDHLFEGLVRFITVRGALHAAGSRKEGRRCPCLRHVPGWMDEIYPKLKACDGLIIASPRCTSSPNPRRSSSSWTARRD